MTGRRFLVVVVAALAALIVVPASPAAATTWSSRSLGHTPYSCGNGSELWVHRYVNVGATIYAAAMDRCGNNTFVTGSPAQGYRRERMAFAGGVEAIARDGSTTYFLRDIANSAGKNTLEIWRRSSAGAYVRTRVLTNAFVILDRLHPADLVVSGGQWTAAWSQAAGSGYAIWVASTLAGHGGHAAMVPLPAAANWDVEPYLAMPSASSVKVIYRESAPADGASLHERRLVAGGFSADRILVKVTGHLQMTGRAVERGSATYFLFNDYRDSARAYALGVVTDNGSTTRIATVGQGNLVGQIAVDAGSGALWVVADQYESGLYPGLYHPVSGVWRSSRIAVGTRDVGFDALTAASGRLAVYYSPAGTPQDTVLYQH